MKKLLSLLASVLLASAAPAMAAIDLVGDDTDLFTLNPNIPSQIPNVLIVIDNTSNWTAANQGWPDVVDPACTTGGLTGSPQKQGNAELCAMYKVIGNLDEQVNVGIMMYEARSSDGGYVRFPMLPMNSTNRTAFQNAVKAVDLNNDNGPSAATQVNIMNDAFRYFNSFATMNGIAAGSTGGPPVPGADSRGYVDSTMTTFKFLANTKDNSCGYDYIIFIGNGFPSNDSATPGITAAAALYNDPSVSVNTSAINNISGKTVQSDIWSRFMFTYGVKTGVDAANNNKGIYRHITTYTIDVCKDHCDADQAVLLKSMADVSQGKYFKATDLSQIETALKQIFQEVQAVNSVFAATTLPVSINVRGTNLNQVYIGVFRPDPAQSPRWLGNLKQYQLGVLNATTGQLGLVDANNVQAVNLNTGFISNTAASIWTDTSTFFSYRSPFASTDAGGASDKPDGDLVEKGGAAQKIRQVYAKPDFDTPQTRNIYTCTGTCASGMSLSSYLFNADNTAITSAALGTFAGINVDTLGGSGTTATATILAGHSFAATDVVVISGAVPAFYNGTFTVLGTPATTATQFSYSVSPNTIDTTHAYVTLPGYTLVPGKDLIKVSATPATYDVSSVAISAVVGNINQFSYTLPGPLYPTVAASAYTVSGVRQVANVASPATTPNMKWDSSAKVTVNLPSHGYNTADAVTVTGATDAAFNVATASITKLDSDRFTYTTVLTPATAPSVTSASATTADPNVSPNAFAWSSGQQVLVCRGGFTGTPATTCSTADNFNTTTAGIGLTPTGATSFDYTTSGNVSGLTAPANSYSAKIINTTTDTNTWNICTGSGCAAPTTSGSGSSTRAVLTLSNQTHPVASQLPHALAVGDLINVTGLTCKKGSNAADCLTASQTTPVATSYGNLTVTAIGTNTVSFAVDNNINGFVVATSPAATVTWTPSTANPTFSKEVNVSTLTPGTASVQASGTIYVSKLGDLTSKVSSISSQGNATGTIVAASSTSASPTERADLIGWVRGLDNIDNENRNADATDVRASVHGDVLHSRPAVVNYNRNGDDNDVFVFYGANDGMLHAIKGASEASGGGKEEWAFIPPEFFGKLKRLRNQTPSIASVTPRDYFFDGPIGVYTLDANKDGKLNAADGDKVYLFIAMRRGGRMLYALDVSDPADPKLLWKKGCSKPTGTGTDGGCDTGFDEIGQTWSQPQLGYLRKWSTTLALMMGAGYDKYAEDAQPCFISAWDSTTVTYKTGVVPPVPMDSTNCPPSGGSTATGTRSMGRGIFILNAVTGAILWRAGPDAGANAQVTGMDYAIPGDLAVMRNRANTSGRAADIGTESVPIGYMDRIYATDTGGNVWRFDVADTSTTPAFAVTKLASIAVAPLSGTHPALNYRKFLFSPDVVYSSDPTGQYDAVLVGSGDREHPFDMVVQNRFYMFKDRNVGTLTVTAITSPNSPPATITDTSSSTDLFDVTNNCLQLNNCTPTGSQTQAEAQAAARAALDAAKGWKLRLTNVGEKTIATATTSAGSVIFNTNQPKDDTSTTGQSSTSACTSDLGTARQYGLNFQDATATNIFNSLPTQYVEAGGRDARFAGGGFLPTPVPVVVQIDGKYYQTVIAGVQTTNPGGLKLQSRLRTYWYRKTD